MAIHYFSENCCKLNIYDGLVLVGYLYAVFVENSVLILNFTPVHRSYTTEQGKQMLEAALNVFRSLGSRYAAYLPNCPNSDLILLFENSGFTADANYRDMLTRAL